MKRSSTDIGWDSVSWMRGGLRLPKSVMVDKVEYKRGEGGWFVLSNMSPKSLVILRV